MYLPHWETRAHHEVFFLIRNNLFYDWGQMGKVLNYFDDFYPMTGCIDIFSGSCLSKVLRQHAIACRYRIVGSLCSIGKHFWSAQREPTLSLPAHCLH